MATNLYDCYDNGISDCCGASIYMGGLCSDCKEHCSAAEEEEESDRPISPAMQSEIVRLKGAWKSQEIEEMD